MPIPRDQPEESDPFYRRRLPHWQPPSAHVFLTWRLFGSLPQETLDRLAAERQRLEQQPLRPDEMPRDRALRHGKRLFALADEVQAGSIQGPQWLRDERIARLVTDALFHYHGNWYALVAFVIMPNHVHLLIQPLAQARSTEPVSDMQGMKYVPQEGGELYVPLHRITRSLKGYTAREANRLLGRTGQPFWQDETYDHCVRDEAELERIVTYIEGDPVRSGLAANLEDWRWSSSWERRWGRLREGT